MRLSTVSAVVLRNMKIWSYKALGQTHRLRPYKVLVSLTNQCNSRCEYCDIWKINPENPELFKQEIKLDDLEGMFKDLNSDLIWLSLTGGEITLVKYFKDMVLAAKRDCPNLRLVTFTSNALAPDRALEYAIMTQPEMRDAALVAKLDAVAGRVL